MIPDQDLGPVEAVQPLPGPGEAGVGDVEAGPGTRGWAGEADVGRREKLLGPHAGVGLDDCLDVHDHGHCHSLVISQLTAVCLTHHLPPISVSLYLQHHNLIELSCGYRNSFSASHQ